MCVCVCVCVSVAHGLRRGSVVSRLLRSWVRIPPVAWMCCLLWVLWMLCLVCVELITRLEGSYLPWCVVVCDIETSWVRRPWPTGGCRAQKIYIFFSCGVGGVQWQTVQANTLWCTSYTSINQILLPSVFCIPTNSAYFGSSDITIPNKVWHISSRESLLTDEMGFYDRNTQWMSDRSLIIANWTAPSTETCLRLLRRTK